MNEMVLESQDLQLDQPEMDYFFIALHLHHLFFASIIQSIDIVLCLSLKLCLEESTFW